MKRRAFLCGMVVAAVLTAAPVLAASAADQVVQQLKGQGYSRIVISRTWLGRTRIVATGANRKREIILNPRTGEILRDVWSRSGNAAGGSSGAGGAILDDDDREGHENSGGRDDDDDDNDDKDDDKDEGDDD